MTEGVAPASSEAVARALGGRAWWLAPVAGALLAAALAAVRIGDAAIQPDEAARIAGARASLAEMWRAARADDLEHLTTHLLWKPWLHVAGASETVARLPSLVLAAVAVTLAVLVGRELLGWVAGAVAGVVLATSSYVLEAAVTVGPTALALALVLASTLALLYAVRTRAAGWWLAYAVVTVALATVDLASTTVVVAHVLLLLHLRPRAWERAAAAVGVAVVGIAAWTALLGRSGSRALDWLPQPTARSVGDALWDVIGHSPVAATAAAGGLVAVAAGWTRARRTPAAWLLGTWLVLPPLVTLAVSLWRPAFAAPYLVASAAALAVLAGAAAAAVTDVRQPAAVLALAAAALTVGSVVSVAHFLRSSGGADWRGATRFLEASHEAGEDVVVSPGSSAPALRYYAPGIPVRRRPTTGSVWVVAADGDDATRRQAGRAVVGAPAYALQRERAFGDGITVQRWVRP